MNVRQTLILVAVFLLGVLTAGAFVGRPAAAEPKGDAATARYQVVPVSNGALRGSVVVIDTATGECWNNDANGKQDDWTAMGVPTKAK